MITISDCVTEFEMAEIFKLENCIKGGWSKGMLKEALFSGSSKFITAAIDNKIIGFINYSMILDEAEINGIAVDDASRRKGIGKKLLDELINKCTLTGIKSIFLEVNENNVAAIALYKNCGFERISIRKNYYGKDSALIYKKSLEIIFKGQV